MILFDFENSAASHRAFMFGELPSLVGDVELMPLNGMFRFVEKRISLFNQAASNSMLRLRMPQLSIQ
eukprot:2267361-Amphidinium_carterae.1